MLVGFFQSAEVIKSIEKRFFFCALGGAAGVTELESESEIEDVGERDLVIDAGGARDWVRSGAGRAVVAGLAENADTRVGLIGKGGGVPSLEGVTTIEGDCL